MESFQIKKLNKNFEMKQKQFKLFLERDNNNNVK